MTNTQQRITINEKYSFSVEDLKSHIANGENTEGEPVDQLLADLLANKMMDSPNVQEAIKFTIDQLDGWSAEPTLTCVMLDFVGWFFYSIDELEDFVTESPDIITNTRRKHNEKNSTDWH